MEKAVQSLVFCLLHQFPFVVGFILKAAEVQQSMYDDAAKLLFLCDTKEFSIGAHSIEADIDVATQGIALRIVETYVIGIVIMPYEAAVDVENGFVVNKNIVDVAQYLAIVCRHSPHPC